MELAFSGDDLAAGFDPGVGDHCAGVLADAEMDAGGEASSRQHGLDGQRGGQAAVFPAQQANGGLDRSPDAHLEVGGRAGIVRATLTEGPWRDGAKRGKDDRAEGEQQQGGLSERRVDGERGAGFKVPTSSESKRHRLSLRGWRGVARYRSARGASGAAVNCGMAATESIAIRDSEFRLTIPAPRLLTSTEEIAMVRGAVERDPGSIRLRLSLASMLVVQDRFKEALALLEQWRTDDVRFLLLEAAALLSVETPEADRRVQAICTKAREIADSDTRRADALSMAAKACIRLGETEEARKALLEALRLNRHDKDAFKRAAALDLREAPERVAEFAAERVREGVLHSRVVASHCLALASLGMMDEARAAQGLDQFFRQEEPAPPAGWNSLEEFNADLARELNEHPDIRYDRYGTASTRTWRIDQPALRRSRIFPALQAMIQREILGYVAGLPEGTHPFLQGRPAQASLRNWCVITEGDGHETWHVHQNGWLSGTYYVQVPDHIVAGTGRGGCIAFGLPEDQVGEENAARFGETLVRPRPGLMLLFPSHTYHRTYSHGGSGRRICYAFDVIPMSGQRTAPTPDEAAPRL